MLSIEINNIFINIFYIRDYKFIKYVTRLLITSPIVNGS